MTLTLVVPIVKFNESCFNTFVIAETSTRLLLLRHDLVSGLKVDLGFGNINTVCDIHIHDGLPLCEV